MTYLCFEFFTLFPKLEWSKVPGGVMHVFTFINRLNKYLISYNKHKKLSLLCINVLFLKNIFFLNWFPVLSGTYDPSFKLKIEMIIIIIIIIIISILIIITMIKIIIIMIVMIVIYYHYYDYDNNNNNK